MKRAPLLSAKTARQALGYVLVGVYEWVVGYEILKQLPLPPFIAFGIQSLLVGGSAFLIRKVFVFQA